MGNTDGKVFKMRRFSQCELRSMMRIPTHAILFQVGDAAPFKQDEMLNVWWWEDEDKPEKGETT